MGKLTCLNRGRDSGEDTSSLETEAEVLTNVARGILQNVCSCAEPKGPWKLGELTEYSLVHMVLTVSLSRDFSTVRWEV